MIYGTISGQNIKIADTVTAAETNNTLTAKFTFSKEWDRLKKIAYFRKSGEESFPFILENDCIPARAGLNLGEGEWEVSIRGYDLRSGSETENTAPRLTTNIAMLHVWETVSPGENEFPEVPKTFAEQILAAAEDAKETAADVERRANAGEFDGRDGNDYDHSEEYARLAAEIAEYGEQVAADRAAIHSNVVEATRKAEAAAGYAEAAAEAATTAEGAQQSAAAAASNANTAASAAADSLQELKDGIARGDFKGDPGARGPQGIQGEQGPAGPPGEKGDTGEPLTVDYVIGHSASDRPNWSELVFNDGTHLEVQSGLNGKDGAEGLTPYVGDNGNWWLPGKTTGSTIIPAVDTGKPSRGDKGDSISIANISESTASGGTSVVTFSDGTQLHIKNGLDGQGGGGSDVTENTVRGWGFAYQSEIPETELLEENTDKLQNAVFSAPVYPVNGGTQYEMRTGYYNPSTGLISYNNKYARTLYLSNGIREGNTLMFNCSPNWLMRFTFLNYRTSSDMDMIENIPYRTVSGTTIVRVPLGANKLGVTFKRENGDISTDVSNEELQEISASFTIFEIPAPVTDQHIIDVITSAFPNAEGVGF